MGGMRPLSSGYFHLADFLEAALLGACGLSWVSALLSYAGYRNAIGWREDPDTFGEGSGIAIDFLLTMAHLGLHLGLVGVGALFIWWLYRGLGDPRLGGTSLAGTKPLARHWAITGWLIPVANLVLPFLMVRQLWQGAQLRRGQPHRVPVTMALWWLSFLASLWVTGMWFVNRDAFASAAATGSFDPLVAYYSITTIKFVLIGFAALFATVTVHRTTESLAHMGS